MCRRESEHGFYDPKTQEARWKGFYDAAAVATYAGMVLVNPIAGGLAVVIWGDDIGDFYSGLAGAKSNQYRIKYESRVKELDLDREMFERRYGPIEPLGPLSFEEKLKMDIARMNEGPTISQRP